MKAKLSLLAAVLVAGCNTLPECETGQPGAADGGFDEPAKRELTVVRHRKAPPLSNKQADLILAAATRALQTRDGKGDVRCNLELMRKGNVTEFSAGDGSIDSGAEFHELMRLPGDVKVVNEINWCGGFMPAIGCALPNAPLVVVSYAPIDGILWAHEYGHTRGLLHRQDDNCSGSRAALMYPGLDSSCKRVNQKECKTFRRKPRRK